MLGARLIGCSEVPESKGAAWVVRLIQQLDGTFLYAGCPDPDPEQRINALGNIMGIPLRHQLLPLFERHGVSVRFFQDTRLIGYTGDVAFSDLSKVDEAAVEFQQLAQELYGRVHPGYGWIDEVGTNQPNPQQVPVVHLSHICWANFFGPSFVERYGRDFLLNAPGWRVEDLGDGGVLYVLSSSFVNRWRQVKAEEIRRYFRQRIPGIRIYRARARQFRE